MKKRHYFFVAAISYCCILIATVPAKLISQFINENTPLSLQGVEGTIWTGKANTILINNDIHLDDTAWSVSAWKLLIGQVTANISTHYRDNEVITEAGTSFLGMFFINDLKTRLPVSEIAQLANIPLVQLTGAINIDIEHAEWKQGTLPIATGKIDWLSASVTVAETVSLGNISITLHESEKEQLRADIKNQGGDIIISGNGELIPAADYAINIKLSPTATASDNIKRSLGLFAEKQANGDFLLINSGSLNQIGLI